jgi:hypothetical protein
MKRRRWVPVLALALGATTCGGEDDESGRPCTLIGCFDYLLIRFEGSTPGEYQITIEADGDIIECTGTVPSSGVVLACSGEPHPEMAGKFETTIAGAPRQVRVTVRRDGVSIADETLTPTYSESQPNGAGCLPICFRAQEVVSLGDP